VDLPDDWTDTDVYQALIDGGYLKDTVKPSDLEIDASDEYFASIDDAKDGRPVFELRLE
jgi:hypothetical protein